MEHLIQQNPGVAGTAMATYNNAKFGMCVTTPEYVTVSVSGKVTVSSNTLTPSIVIPVTFIINPPACDPVQNAAIEVVDFNTMHLTWSAPANAENLMAYGIYHNDDKTPFATVDPSETVYDDEGLAPGQYCYRVRAMYTDGCVSMSDILLCENATLQYGTVSGTVTDSYTGAAIGGATIRFNGNNITTTEEDGTYSIDLVTGTYNNVKVMANGYSTLIIPTVNVVVYENTLDIQLESSLKPAKTYRQH